MEEEKREKLLDWAGIACGLLIFCFYYRPVCRAQIYSGKQKGKSRQTQTAQDGFRELQDDSVRFPDAHRDNPDRITMGRAVPVVLFTFAGVNTLIRYLAFSCASFNTRFSSKFEYFNVICCL